MTTVARAFTIALRIVGYLSWLATWRLGFRTGEAPPRRFAAMLEGLGTPFIKLGQALTLRQRLRKRNVFRQPLTLL